MRCINYLYARLNHVLDYTKFVYIIVSQWQNFFREKGEMGLNLGNAFRKSQRKTFIARKNGGGLS